MIRQSAKQHPENAAHPPDNAQAPVIDEYSGVWLVKSSESTGTQGAGTSSQASPVSCDSGLRESDDSVTGPAVGDASHTDASDLFGAAPEPNGDANPTGTGTQPGCHRTSVAVVLIWSTV